MSNLRNLPTDQAKNLTDMVDYKENQIISMALSKSKHIDMTILAFADKESVSEEDYFGDTMYYILEGEAIVEEGNKMTILKAGDTLMVPAHVLHKVTSLKAFKVLQITIYE